MYLLFLTLRYLRKRRLAFFSVAAVALCVAMVIVVSSVMGGFLENLLNASQGLLGDVVVETSSLAGFPHYKQFISRLEADAMVEAATPVVYMYGILRIYNTHTVAIRMVGMDPESRSRVCAFKESLHRQKGIAAPPSFNVPGKKIADGQREVPGCILGLDIIGERDEKGQYHRNLDFNSRVIVSLLPIKRSGSLSVNAVVRPFIYVDDSHTGVYHVDSYHVYVPLEAAQKMCGMAERRDDDGNVIPARATQVQIKAADGVRADDLCTRVNDMWEEYVKAHPKDLAYLMMNIETWEQKQRDFVNAVKKERLVVIILFAMISAVTVFLVFAIFYMIVVEKTRDIGIIKSFGGSSSGVAAIFLAYGAFIGLIGSALGTLIGTLFVVNINSIERMVNRWTGFKLYDPKVYLFDEIPDHVDWTTTTWVIIIAVLCSVLGALWPAIKAAMLNPVEAIRYE